MGLSRSERLVLVLLSVAILGGRVARNRLERAGDLVVVADSAAAAAAARADPPASAPGGLGGDRDSARQDSAGRGARPRERAGEGTVERAAGPVDLNSATPEELMLLPGIGPTKAAAIVERRRTRGPFQKSADLLDVPGIGPKTLAQLEGLVTVGARAAPAGGAR